MSEARARAVVLATTLIAAAAGCAGPSLDTQAPPGVDLAGQWVLDPQASDDTRAALKRALPARDAPLAPLPPNLDASLPDNNRPPGQHRSRQDQPPVVIVDDTPRLPLAQRAQFAMSYVVAPSHIEVTQSPSGIELVQGDRDRRFSSESDEPTSVTDRYGTRIVRAGWRGAEFDVRTHDGRSLRIEESFRRGRQPDTLEVEVRFSNDHMKSVHVKSVYRRGTIEDQGSEGPPETGPR